MPSVMNTSVISREDLQAMFSEPEPMSDKERAALERLLKIGRSDTGQSRRVADFLLAWWNAGSCGGFDLTDLWAVDTAIATDMVTVVGLIARVNSYPDTLGYGEQFEALVREWRPELVNPSPEAAKALEKAKQQTDERGRVDMLATLVTYGSAPGYRDANLVFDLKPLHGGAAPFRADLQIRPQDAESIVRHLRDVHELAWRNGAPLDAEPGEKRPAWINRS
ncbi:MULTISPECIES: DUF7673 family protein [unclassified Rhodanobacter]|uniref:Uncharacterized protein n=1 Tax=Rhodanobacter humi TaxID=1888173 RepID=A0ABV4AX58_9GAMM